MASLDSRGDLSLSLYKSLIFMQQELIILWFWVRGSLTSACISLAMAQDQPQNDEIDEKSINNWLPITSSRNAKWWYSAFHNVTAMVGAGVLSLPYSMAELGW